MRNFAVYRDVFKGTYPGSMKGIVSEPFFYCQADFKQVYHEVVFRSGKLYGKTGFRVSALRRIRRGEKPGMTINGKELMTHYTLCSVLIQLQFRMFRNGFEMFIIRKNRNFISYGNGCYCHIYRRDRDSLAPQFFIQRRGI